MMTEKCMETEKEVESHVIDELKKKDRKNSWFKESDDEIQISKENGYERKISRLKGKRNKHRSDKHENSNSDENIDDDANGSCDDEESENKSDSKDA